MTDQTKRDSAISALREVQDTPETVENHHTIDNEIFEQYVSGDRDIVGMLAYCFYKREKVSICEQNPQMTQQEIIEQCREFIKPKKYDEYKAEAQQTIGFLESDVISRYVRGKAARDWFIGIISGLVAAIVAPVIFAKLASMISESGVTAPYDKPFQNRTEQTQPSVIHFDAKPPNSP